MTPEDYSDAYRKGFELTKRFLLSRGVPTESAEEAAQAAWARGWERRKSLRNPSMVITWVNSIALNLFRNWLRKDRATDELPLNLARAPEARPSTIDAQRTLQLCDPAERDLLKKLYIEGYTSAEVAEISNCKPVTVRVRVMRAKKKIQKLMKDGEHDQQAAEQEQPLAHAA